MRRFGHKLFLDEVKLMTNLGDSGHHNLESRDEHHTSHTKSDDCILTQ